MNAKEARAAGLTIKHFKNNKKIPVYRDIPGDTPRQKVYNILCMLRWEPDKIASALNITEAWAKNILSQHKKKY